MLLVHLFIKRRVVNYVCYIVIRNCIIFFGARGGAAVKALRYKPEGRGIDSRWC
jgi:hypothetical protein